MQRQLSEEKARPYKPDREELKRRALSVSGRFRSGLSDLSAEHDLYLDEALRAPIRTSDDDLRPEGAGT